MQVLGVSTDSIEANAAFAARYHFPFPLLSDITRKICLAYEACDSADTPATRRMTYVIAQDGTVLQGFAGYDSANLAEQTLALLRQ